MITLSDLEGRWHLSRVIEDARAGITGRLEGEAVWRPDADGLVQEEVGLLNYGDAPPMQASRRYLWRSRGGEIEVLFEDGRAFHTLPDAGAEAVHHCDPDLYRVTYDFALPGAFTQVWRVTGPRKDAVLASRFTRL
ncbi:DUF6314 family protein [Gymnodinialimonas hymeniacidonis]|uniref:DUF6314 family protein n=1 Tax=Gymnodinialimonas hymeniacidonis TaxID=3126508 RepID=UPI0034C5E14A